MTGCGLLTYIFKIDFEFKGKRVLPRVNWDTGISGALEKGWERTCKSHQCRTMRGNLVNIRIN